MYIERRFGSHRALSSEDFNTAGRSIKTGLTASNVVSQWTWAATLLQSSNVAFEYGVSGPFWYAAGATIQVRGECEPVCRSGCMRGRDVSVPLFDTVTLNVPSAHN